MSSHDANPGSLSDATTLSLPGYWKPRIPVLRRVADDSELDVRDAVLLWVLERERNARIELGGVLLSTYADLSYVCISKGVQSRGAKLSSTPRGTVRSVEGGQRSWIAGRHVHRGQRRHPHGPRPVAEELRVEAHEAGESAFATAMFFVGFLLSLIIRHGCRLGYPPP
jgi:hypothetical protein